MKKIFEQKIMDRNTLSHSRRWLCHNSIGVALDQFLNTNVFAGGPKEKPNRLPREELLRKLPQWSRSPKYLDMLRVKKANKFLKFQSRRIDKALIEGNLEKAVFIWTLVAKTSNAYQLALFTLVVRGWYFSYSEESSIKILIGCMNKMRALDLKLVLNRFYILKKNGKWRPIGAPNMESRVMSKFITDMLYFSVEKDFKHFQHGFRKQRGTQTALVKALQKFFENVHAELYEFDLKSFFNTVAWQGVIQQLEHKCDLLAGIVGSVLREIRCRFPMGLKEESEYKDTNKTVGIGKKKKGITRKQVPLYERYGMPQGLSLSPLMATLALEYGKIPKSLLMYADDGLFIGTYEEIQKGIKWLKTLGSYGVLVQDSKTRFIEKISSPIHWGLLNIPGHFRFLGVDFHLHQKIIQYKSFKFHFEDYGADGGRSEGEILLDFARWLRGHHIKYSDDIRENKGGRELWCIQTNSILHQLRSTMRTQMEELNPYLFFVTITFIKGWIFDLTHHGYRFCWGWNSVDQEAQGIYDIQTGSSQATEHILRKMGTFKLSRRRSLDTFIDRINESNYIDKPLIKKDYAELPVLNRDKTQNLDFQQLWVYTPLNKEYENQLIGTDGRHGQYYADFFKELKVHQKKWASE